MKNKTKIILISIIGVLIVVLTYLIIFVNNIIKLNRFDDVKINISGSELEVFNILQENGIINDANSCYYYARIIKKPNFKEGVYNISNKEIANLNELIDYLSNANNIIKTKITFTPGMWLKECAKELSLNTNLSYKEIMEKWSSKEFAKQYIGKYSFLTEEILNEHIRYPFEGYFMPDTYVIEYNTSIEAITDFLLQHTADVLSEFQNQITASDYTIHQLLSLASIVLYESSDPIYQEDIASVFINRLNDGMPLQSSITVCYAIDIDKEKDSWVECEINPDFDSYYNTYLYGGLTPGPVCNFTVDSLKAVLENKKTDYYYFIGDVCNNTGAVIFASSLQDHQANVRKYLTCY